MITRIAVVALLLISPYTALAERDWKLTFPQINNSDKITTLAKECPNTPNINCNDDIYQKVWLHLEATNGERYRLNLNSVMDGTTGNKIALVYITPPNVGLDMTRMRRLMFNCNGTFIDITNGISNNVMDAPPNSVAGRIQKIICRVPTAQQYCVGLSSSECNNVSKVINSNNRPSYCKQGYGLVDSGLNNEQRRICAVMGTWN
ncbi:hypothetical protein G6731_01045 [Polynucleobacter paneuropaeus]|uniref:DUF4189 domain-containing protein n=1 Tax=Polynucleobacter paneuropaeus TaxID=2527775 RepID=A0A9Q2WHF2_9BURK|nr:hypothetical protein [Polynucleobacter paneuropaeus]